MPSTVRDFLFVLGTYFPQYMNIRQALYILQTVGSFHRLIGLHEAQSRLPRQRRITGWMQSALDIVRSAFEAGREDPEVVDETEEQCILRLQADLPIIYEFLDYDKQNDHVSLLVPEVHLVLSTSRQTCIICATEEKEELLRRHGPIQIARVLDADCVWKAADLVVALCPSKTCRACYFPDLITFRGPNNQRLQRLECDTLYLRFASNRGIWAHRSIAVQQEKALIHFHAGWSNMASWFNDCLAPVPALTARQTKRLFIEHFSRRLLTSRNHEETFTCRAYPGADELAACVRQVLGVNGGVIDASHKHGCQDCTHQKRYRAELVREGVVLDERRDQVADLPDVLEPQGNNLEGLPMPPGLPEDNPVPEEEPGPGEPRGFVRMAVMDGKTITHRVCSSASNMAKCSDVRFADLLCQLLQKPACQLQERSLLFRSSPSTQQVRHHTLRSRH